MERLSASSDPKTSTTAESKVNEKAEATNELNVMTKKGKYDIYNPGVDTSGVDERKIMRKVDLALIPWLSLLYLLSFLDRTSIGKCVSAAFSLYLRQSI